jgi:hypothetical protein
VGILVLDGAFIVAAVAAARWASRRPARVTPLVGALTAGAAFVAIRDHYDAEDAAFLWSLIALCLLGAALTATASSAFRQTARATLAYSTLAAALVPVVFGASLVVRYTLCLLTSCDKS